MSERVPCGTPGCSATILPATALKTGGICMPCANRAAAEAHARYVAAHRVDVDPFAGVSDVVEILRLIHSPPPSDELKRLLPYEKTEAELYRALTQGDADRLVLVASKDESFLHHVAGHLARLASIDMNRCHQTLLDTGDPYPAHAFRAANAAVVDRLFALLERSIHEENVLRIDHALVALAWARSRRVIDTMIEWSRRPPAWTTLLHLAPHEYATCAGYQIEDGRAQDLVLGQALRLVAAKEPSNPSAIVSLFEPIVGDACPRCGRGAVSLMSVDTAGLPEEISASVPSTVPTCLPCACFEKTFAQLASDGPWSWLPSNGAARAEPGEGWNPPPHRASIAPRRAWEAADWGDAEGVSQIGGHPSWVQDAVYPRCPKCSRTMMTVAQVGLEDFLDPAEGVFYVHHCAACAVVGVGYQQS